MPGRCGQALSWERRNRACIFKRCWPSSQPSFSGKGSRTQVLGRCWHCVCCKRFRSLLPISEDDRTKVRSGLHRKRLECGDWVAKEWGYQNVSGRFRLIADFRFSIFSACFAPKATPDTDQCSVDSGLKLNRHGFELTPRSWTDSSFIFRQKTNALDAYARP